MNPYNDNKYSKNVVYKINGDGDKPYIEQTSRPVKLRISEHIQNFKLKNWKNQDSLKNIL